MAVRRIVVVIVLIITAVVVWLQARQRLFGDEETADRRIEPGWSPPSVPRPGISPSALAPTPLAPDAAVIVSEIAPSLTPAGEAVVDAVMVVDELPADATASDENGTCPASHPIKANPSSHIYHVPGQSSYERLKAGLCFVSGEAAEAAGYRASRSTMLGASDDPANSDTGAETE